MFRIDHSKFCVSSNLPQFGPTYSHIKPSRERFSSKYVDTVKQTYDREKCKLYATQYGPVALMSLGAVQPDQFLSRDFPRDLVSLPAEFMGLKAPKGMEAKEIKEPKLPLWIAESEFTGKVSTILGASTWVYNRNECFTLRFRKFTANGLVHKYIPVTGFGYHKLLEIAKIIELSNPSYKVYVINQRRPKNAIPIGLIRTKSAVYLTMPEIEERTRKHKDIFMMQKLPFTITPIGSPEEKTGEYLVRIQSPSFAKSLKAALAFVAKALCDKVQAGFSNPSRS